MGQIKLEEDIQKVYFREYVSGKPLGIVFELSDDGSVKHTWYEAKNVITNINDPEWEGLKEYDLTGILENIKGFLIETGKSIRIGGYYVNGKFYVLHCLQFIGDLNPKTRVGGKPNYKIKNHFLIWKDEHIQVSFGSHDIDLPNLPKLPFELLKIYTYVGDFSKISIVDARDIILKEPIKSEINPDENIEHLTYVSLKKYTLTNKNTK